MSIEDKLPKKTEKPWGFEILFARTPEYVGKVIFVKKGHRLSLQYHTMKDESIYLSEGRAMVEIGESDGHITSTVLQPGQCLRIPPLTKHRFKAIEDTTLFEVSTPEIEGDTTRLEDDYGRVG